MHGRAPTPLPRCFCIVRLFSYQRFKYFHFWLNISAQDKTYNLDFFEQLSKSMSVTTDKNTDKNITGTVKWIYSDNRKMCIFAGIRASISLPVFQLELIIPHFYCHCCCGSRNQNLTGLTNQILSRQIINPSNLCNSLKKLIRNRDRSALKCKLP